MTASERPLRIAIVAGEESGDLLAADLIDALGALQGRPVELVGVGGEHLAARGLVSFFDPDEIALVGIGAVLARLPQLVWRIGRTARAIADAKPDCMITVDVPDFSLRVAKKVRAIDPSIPIVHYVCPSVWAWRPQRARHMRDFVDHVLCVLPFEPAELSRLQGPPGTYVGHRLASSPRVLAVRDAQRRRGAPDRDRPNLLVLPGSRRGEVKRLLQPFGETVAALKARGHRPRILVPTVPKVEALVREGMASWALPAEIETGEDARYRMFGAADVALAASGTVTLELALAGIPTISCYKVEPIARPLYAIITIWSASLPNIIADRPVYPEYYDGFLRAGMLSRQLERLLDDGHERAAQKAGLAIVAERMTTERPAGEIAARTVMETMVKRPT